MASSSSVRGLFRLSAELEHLLSSSPSHLSAKVVLLESAILTHGMPYPQNLAMAKRVQQIIRDNGAHPATVGLLDGRVHVGLDDDQLERLAAPPAHAQRPRMKVSRRDFPVAASSLADGGTTVAGTLAVAHRLRLPLFVTGGLGGVHRGGQHSMDVSADLVEMGRASTCVVSSGVKSILDIGRTLEVLESQGVSVATLGPSADFPAFFSRTSGGLQSPHHVTSISEAARLILAHHGLDLGSGLLLAVPIPECASADGHAIEANIQAALAEAEAAGVTGRRVTPFVLERVNQLTQGVSLKANLALIENNADVGSRIAVELARMEEEQCTSHDDTFSSSSSSSSSRRPFVLGGSIFDLVTSIDEDVINLNNSTHKGSVDVGYGGVGRNLADALACFDADPVFLSAVGQDELGQRILAHNPRLSKADVLTLSSHRTAMYNVLLDRSGQARLGVGDMSIHETIDAARILREAERMRREASVVAFDGNLSQKAIHQLLSCMSSSRLPLFFEPTDSRKARKVLSSPNVASITYATPNALELLEMAAAPAPTAATTSPSSHDELRRLLNLCIDAGQDLLRALQVIIVTLGEHGVLVVRRGRPHEPLPLANAPELSPPPTTLSATHYPVPPSQRMDQVASVSGAGDCFAAAFIASLLRDDAGRAQDRSVAVGMQAARLSLLDTKSVPFDLDAGKIDWRLKAKGNVMM